MEQLNMFTDMGCQITPLSAICRYIRDYWEDVLLDRLHRDPDDEGPEYQPDPSFCKFVGGLFRSWHGGSGAMDRYGIRSWQFKPGMVELTRLDGSTAAVSQSKVMGELGLWKGGGGE